MVDAYNNLTGNILSHIILEHVKERLKPISKKGLGQEREFPFVYLCWIQSISYIANAYSNNLKQHVLCIYWYLWSFDQ